MTLTVEQCKAVPSISSPPTPDSESTMRNQKLVAKLDSDRENVPFPVPEPFAFNAFDHALRDVLDQNDLGRGWEYDPHTRTWGKRFRESVVVGGRRGGMDCTFTLDPAKGIAAEILRLQHEVDEWQRACAVTVAAFEARRIAERA